MIDPLCRTIIEQLKINRFVETGTDKGETVAAVSHWFAETHPGFGHIDGYTQNGSRSYNTWNKKIQYPHFVGSSTSSFQIHSVDTDAHSCEQAQAVFRSNTNIFIHRDSSEKFLQGLIRDQAAKQEAEVNYLFFLDAHWGEYWPLRDEIKAIRSLKRYVIVIDDFFIPGKSDPAQPHGAFGFDLYRSTILNWVYICDLFDNIPVRVLYPCKPNRDRRGWVVILHGYEEAELAFLMGSDFFELKQNDPAHARAVKAPWQSWFDRRNMLKRIIPVSVLRSTHRLYERLANSKN